jgi:hypothetical protein
MDRGDRPGHNPARARAAPDHRVADQHKLAVVKVIGKPAAGLELSEAGLAEIAGAVPTDAVAGTRYPEAAMRGLGR